MSEPLAGGERTPVPARRSRYRGHRAASTMAVAAIVGTAVGAGVAVVDRGSSPAMSAMAAPAGAADLSGMTNGALNPGAGAAHASAGGLRPDPARQAWAHRYGVDRSTMADLSDVT